MVVIGRAERKVCVFFRVILFCINITIRVCVWKVHRPKNEVEQIPLFRFIVCLVYVIQGDPKKKRSFFIER